MDTSGWPHRHNSALRVTGLTAPGVFDGAIDERRLTLVPTLARRHVFGAHGAIDGESFRAYIEQILVPTL